MQSVKKALGNTGENPQRVWAVEARKALPDAPVNGYTKTCRSSVNPKGINDG
jgi:hypothetical protein